MQHQFSCRFPCRRISNTRRVGMLLLLKGQLRCQAKRRFQRFLNASPPLLPLWQLSWTSSHRYFYDQSLVRLFYFPFSPCGLLASQGVILLSYFKQQHNYHFRHMSLTSARVGKAFMLAGYLSLRDEWLGFCWISCLKYDNWKRWSPILVP